MKFRLRTSFYAAPLIALFAFAGCGDDGTGLDDTIEIVRFTVGTQTVYFDESGVRTCCDGAGNATLPRYIWIPATGATATQVSVATFHRSDGSPIILDPNVYELRVVPGATRITWTALPYPSGANLPFSGNLRRTAAGPTPVEISVVQKSSGQTVFGPKTFNICTVTATATTDTCAS